MRSQQQWEATTLAIPGIYSWQSPSLSVDSCAVRRAPSTHKREASADSVEPQGVWKYKHTHKSTRKEKCWGKSPTSMLCGNGMLADCCSGEEGRGKLNILKEGMASWLPWTTGFKTATKSVFPEINQIRAQNLLPVPYLTLLSIWGNQNKYSQSKSWLFNGCKTINL